MGKFCLKYDEMAWAKRDYSLKQYNGAGCTLIDPTISEEQKEEAYKVVNNWRAIHAFPLNTFQNRLREKAKEIDKFSTVAQRTKRLDSINKKLLRLDKMNLCQIQDIAGCRAILGNIEQVNRLVQSYYESEFKHKLSKVNDYIAEPKPTGYRCIHLVYKYYSDRNDRYNGLKIEVQIRSIMQHAWATAVETVDTFTQQSLKTNQGSEDWTRFFALMGSAMAIIEKGPLVPETPTNRDLLKKELIEYESKLGVTQTLQTFGKTLKLLEKPADKNHLYFLLELYPKTNKVNLYGYSKSNLKEAMEDYLIAEREAVKFSGNVVLVSADSMDGLRRAYPNYFLDTNLFLQSLNQILK